MHADQTDELIEKIAEKPAMYVGAASIFNVFHFLNGHSLTRVLAGDPNPLAGWGRWVEASFGISDPAFSWATILAAQCGGEAAAVQALPSLWRRFRESRNVADSHVESPAEARDRETGDAALAALGIRVVRRQRRHDDLRRRLGPCRDTSTKRVEAALAFGEARAKDVWSAAFASAFGVLAACTPQSEVV